MNDTPGETAERSWEKAELLDLLLMKEGAEFNSFPLSFAQQRLWFLDQLEPGNAVYNVPAAVRLLGALNEAALEESLNEVVARHETLRTSFMTVDGQPVQIIAPERKLRLRATDLRGLPETGRADEVLRAAMTEAQQPFDLGRGPLLRVTLLRLGEEEHVALLTMHHIVSDGWSMGVLIKELGVLYEAFAGGKPSPLPELPLQYADYAHWQREWLQGEVLEERLSYWGRQLAGLPVLSLPSDRPRPPVQTFRGAKLPVTFDAGLTASLKALGERHGATLFMTLLTAFKVLLSRYTEQEDICLGTAVAGRDRVELEGLIGLFANTLVLRTDLSGDPTFTEALARLRRSMLDAHAYQDLPFEKLVEALHAERDLSRNPLFQVFFILQNAPSPPLELKGLVISPVKIEVGSSKFDLTLAMEEGGDGLTGSFEYNTDLFDADTIRRMGEHFLTLLNSVAADPGRHISQLEVLTPEERQRLTAEWNDTRVDYPKGACLHQLFEAQAAQTPAAVAAVFEGESLTYRELNERANQLAHHLRGMGVGAEARVGIFMERSLEMLVALLGTLKAGAAYVPLDPTYPRQRLAYMIEDARPAALLTQRRLKGGLPEHGARAVCLDADWEAVAANSAHDLEGVADAESAAYVIYTSGSTGRPKGVVISHRNVVNFFTGMDACVDFEPQDVWLAVTSISFDISVLELLWTLARGLKVVVQAEHDLSPAAGADASPRTSARPMEFSLFYFASAAEEGGEDKYRLLMEGAKFADRHGFSAVWTPERHFHAFGGLYPNPSVAGAAIAAVTERVQVRAGSVVLPLHDPVRVAEEWSVVDNISRGRVAVSFASGWHANDFVLLPANYARRKELMLSGIETVRELWRGGSVVRPNGTGQPTEIRILPRPVQPELPVWLTAAGNPDTFRAAGEMGANVLTHLLGQTPDELAEKIAVYREAWEAHGRAPGAGRVTLMLHTFVGEDLGDVREKVRAPFTEYLRTSLDLLRTLARARGEDLDSADFTEEQMQALLSNAFERYFGTSALFGTPASCLPLVERLKALGVDEIACLIDFGVEQSAVMSSLEQLALLKERSNAKADAGEADYSIPRQLTGHRVTHMQCTPSMAKMLAAEHGGFDVLAGLRQLLLGGEALPVHLAEQLAEALPGRVRNMYGPTETTVWSTTHPAVPSGNSVPVGRPISNTTVYILNKKLQLALTGAPGGVYIGGDGVARGYLNRPALTAERFIPDPFGREPGARLYSTGDVARHLPDGAIEFLGRADNQVKLRGFRIEAGEIETALASHPAVGEAVVTVWEDAPGEKRLVAYWVARPGQSAAPGQLRDHVKERLPEYMIPSAFVPLPAFPLTPNGKIDRRALPAPEGSRAVAGQAYVAPRTPVEEVLAAIWAQIFRVERVGAADNFFDLGGHSLLAAQVVARVRKTFRIDLPVHSLFRSPTVAGLAEAIAAAMKAGGGLQAPPLLPAGRDGALPLSFAQQRLWFLDRFEQGGSLYNVPMAIRLSGSLDVAALGRSLDEIVRRHEVLRTTYTEAEGRPVQIVGEHRGLDMPVTDLSDLAAGEREAAARRLAEEEAERPFDLARGPVLRASLLRTARDEHTLLLTMHHIVSDAWSKGVLLRELVALYKAYSGGLPSPLPELTLQYADYAVWQRQWLQGEALETRLAYWRQRLAGAPPLLELPADRPRPAVQSFRGATHPLMLTPALREQLKDLSRQERATLFMTLLASFQTLLHLYTGREDIVVGTNVANRDSVETEWLIGFFINHVVMRTDLSGSPTFRELLGRVREVCLSAYAHQDLPFDQLVKGLNPKRDASYHPVFQVLLVLQNAPRVEVELENLAMSQLEHEDDTAQFDLALFLEEIEEGVVGLWRYSTDLFDAATIARLSDDFVALLEKVVSEPGARLNELAVIKPRDAEPRGDGAGAAGPGGVRAAKIKRLKSAKRQPVAVAEVSLIRASYLPEGPTLPLVIEPAADDIDWAAWAADQREYVEAELLKHGAILFRGWGVNAPDKFERFARCLEPDLFDEYGDLPREGAGGSIYKSTPYPADQTILFHNESSHLHHWPRKIFFCCVKAAQRGGETPIADCREVYRLLDPEVRERFERKNLMYVRNYTAGLDVSWQSFFHTEDRAAVEEACRKASMEFAWKENDGLRTRRAAQSVARHPTTGETVFFNQIQLHHFSCLDPAVRQSLLSVFGREDLPRDVRYGDGTPIEDEVVAHVIDVYKRVAVSFPWREGDVMMLDNMLTAHGRYPYAGQRKVLVAMGDLIGRDDLTP